MQMSSDRCADALNISNCRWQCIQGQGPWHQTNKISMKSEDKEKPVVLVVQIVGALAQTAKGVGSSPTKCYPFPCSVWVVCEKILFMISFFHEH